MLYSKLFGKTVKEAPKDANLISHKLLFQAGFIRENTAGRYYLLPLGLLVHEKIKKIIKNEMDKAGAQEIITPVLHPIDLWKETNRANSVGFELMKIKDRNDAEFVLGGTAEEMLVDLVRKFQISYRDLPFNLYQFSTKFRDELRARGGLLRLREFVMKDAYSFHETDKDFKTEYENMKKTYARIFDLLGLKTIIVESDNGYIGGEYCHEFVVESPAGESKFFMTEDGSYAAHEEVAVFYRDNKNLDEEEKPMRSVEAKRGNTMEDGRKLHGLPMWQQIKDLMMVNEKGQMILAVIRGDLDVNEIKLLHAVKSYKLRHATEQEIRELGSEPGFISPIGIKELAKKNNVELIVVGDISLRTIKNAYTGDNSKYRDLMDVNIDRDYKIDIEADIALAEEGYLSEDKKSLIAKKGIEVGNIFQLGFHYSSKMKDAAFTDEKGVKKPYYMGCYGIGLERSLAAIVEVHHDKKGIVWPRAVAPYDAHLIEIQNSKFKIQNDKSKVKGFGNEVYERLQKAGIEVLHDDREGVSAGEKFADADLIGIPVRLVISSRSGGKVEWKERSGEKTELISVEEAIKRLKTEEV